MTTAIIIAGGSGSRMGQDIPKQFINVYDKPVIIYTLEGFQKHPQIDAIEVVCIDGWHDVLWAYAKQFNIDKLKWIVSGGSTGQESIRNGVYNLEGKANPDDIIIIHDGIRPLVEDMVLTDVIIKAKKYGNAVTSLPYNEQIFVIDDETSTTKFIPRETLRRVSTPQAYRFDLLDEKYHFLFTGDMTCHDGVLLNFPESTAVSIFRNSILAIKVLCEKEHVVSLFPGHQNTPEPTEILDSYLLLCEKLLSSHDPEVWKSGRITDGTTTIRFRPEKEGE